MIDVEHFSSLPENKVDNGGKKTKSFHALTDIKFITGLFCLNIFIYNFNWSQLT